eukprot:scaffold5940_cov143-Alexandrium_tamarense.AAC.1
MMEMRIVVGLFEWIDRVQSYYDPESGWDYNSELYKNDERYLCEGRCCVVWVDVGRCSVEGRVAEAMEVVVYGL